MTSPEDPPRQHSLFTRALLYVPVAIIRFATRVSRKEPIEGIKWEEIEIPSRDAGRTIKAFRYYRADRVRQGPRDVLLNFHGSGWMLHLWGEDHLYAGQVAKELDIDVYDMDYRKGPEAPFPAAHDDVEDAILHFANKDDVKSVSLSGFSAGANMAISGSANVQEKLSQSRIKEISSISVLYPPCDWSIADHAPSKNCEGGGLLLPPFVIWLFNACAVVDPRSFLTKRFSIAKLASPAQDIPSKHIVIVTGDGDHLHDGGVRFVKALQDGGHPDATFISLKNAGHSFDKSPKTDLARKYTASAYEAVIANIQRGLGAAGGQSNETTLRRRQGAGTTA
ncbi:unnamed protein product [Tilletia controversa]|uniref:Alpha/beta hydrolase fold-3 domain-containing protein n=1 Tax=Tilletia controversa TaxID=13291 RepID=A0A8X7MXV5_9BASI|nr:hypothetical protein CF328_g425 [Tilletia controversa]KAE8252270.1 hypothetical protein A4X06_0g2311 [Tilletia controversa]CAD6905225.1 unnamed protein product [Tilletia controversa]CAD6921623.1 unnamed protein product [Tilletia controversa]